MTWQKSDSSKAPTDLHKDLGLNSWPRGALRTTWSSAHSAALCLLWKLQLSRFHSLSGSKVVIQYRHDHPAREVQPAPGAADSFLHSTNPVCSLHIHHKIPASAVKLSRPNDSWHHFNAYVIISQTAWLSICPWVYFLDSEIFDCSGDKVCSANNNTLRYSFMSLITLVQLVHLAFISTGYESAVD